MKDKYKMSVHRNKGSLLSSRCVWRIIIDKEDDRNAAVVLLKNAALASAYEFIAPDIDSAAPSDISALSSSFNNAIMQLGEGWAVQFELQKTEANDYPGSEIESLSAFVVERQREANFSFSNKHFVNRYFLTFTYSLPSEIEQKSAGFFFKKNKVIGTAETGSFRKQLKYFKAELAKVIAKIDRDMYVKKLSCNELVTYLHTTVSLDWHPMHIPEDYPIFLDSIITDQTLETSTPMKLGDNYIPIIAVKAFPSSKTLPAMLDALNKAAVPFRWSTRFITYSRETALNKIQRMEKKFHGQKTSIGQVLFEMFTKVPSTRENSGAVAQAVDASQANIDCTRGYTGFGDYTSNVQVWDENLERAEEKAKYIAGIIGACGFAVGEESFNALQAYCSMQPGNVFANQRKLFVSTGNASHVVPFSSVWSGEKNNKFLESISGNGNPHLICSTNAGIPFYLNLNVSDVGHHFIAGPTGAGKSTYLAALANQWKKYPNSQVIFFDKDLSARNVTMCEGGIYIEPGKDDIAFQPLRNIDTSNEQNWATDFIQCLLSEQNVVITPTMRTVIFNAIKILAESPKDERTISDFYNYCNYENPETGLNDIRIALEPYRLTGPFGNLFDRVQEDLSLHKWIMFEMGTLMNLTAGAIAPSLMYLFNQCEKMFDGSPTLLILDEAWVMLKNKFFAKKIEEWLKVLRKKHVFVVFATQETADAVKSPIASTIISQCATKVFLADPQATTAMMRESYKLFGLTESEIRLLSRSVKKQDYFYKSELGTRQFQLELDPFQLAIMTNSKSDHKTLDKVENEYGKNTGKALVKEILLAKNEDFAVYF